MSCFPCKIDLSSSINEAKSASYRWKKIFLLQKELWQCSGTISNNAKLGILNRLELRQTNFWPDSLLSKIRGAKTSFAAQDRGWPVVIRKRISDQWRGSGVSKGRNLPCFWRQDFSRAAPPVIVYLSGPNHDIWWKTLHLLGYTFMSRKKQSRKYLLGRSYENDEFDWLFDFVIVTWKNNPLRKVQCRYVPTYPGANSRSGLVILARRFVNET